MRRFEPDATAHAEERARLKEIIRRLSFKDNVEIKLASGRTSNFYFNLKPTMLDAVGAHLLGLLVGERVAALGGELVGGLEMGAVPLATAVATESGRSAHPISAFFVRKQAKEHGTRALIEGLPPGATLAGRRVVVLEDVTTTGGSALKAVEVVRADGAEVAGVVTIVDREEGAEATFAAANVTFSPLFRGGEFRR
ncbi:MAG: orotate phosphoribosyltransferase [Hyphomicrobiaceae bacterium]